MKERNIRIPGVSSSYGSVKGKKVRTKLFIFKTRHLDLFKGAGKDASNVKYYVT